MTASRLDSFLKTTLNSSGNLAPKSNASDVHEVESGFKEAKLELDNVVSVGKTAAPKEAAPAGEKVKPDLAVPDDDCCAIKSAARLEG